MPYAIAHPVAVIPLHRWLGARSAPSALVIGSVIPDTWYFLPFLGRPDTHTVHGALLFCVPLTLLVYAVFHLVMKQPLLALLPPRLAARLQAWTVRGLPPARWTAVALSAAAGALTHVVWDSFTHEGLLSARYPWLEALLFSAGGYELRLYQLFQHASTLGGGLFLAWWIRGKLARMPEPPPLAQERPHGFIAFALALVPVLVFAEALVPRLGPGVEELRAAVRAAGISAAAALAVAFVAYCVLWRCRELLPWTRKALS